MKEFIMELLAAGKESQATIATIVGCDSSYISQLLVDQNFVQELNEKKTKLGNSGSNRSLAQVQANTSHDMKLDTLEDRAMTRLGQLIPSITKPMEAAKVLQILNSAKRKNDLQGSTVLNQQNNVVVLQLPQMVKTKLAVNHNNEVVEVDDRPLVTINSQHLLKVNQEKLAQEKLEEQKLLDSIKQDKPVSKMTVEDMIEEIT